MYPADRDNVAEPCYSVVLYQSNSYWEMSITCNSRFDRCDTVQFGGVLIYSSMKFRKLITCSRHCHETSIQLIQSCPVFSSVNCNQIFAFNQSQIKVTYYYKSIIWSLIIIKRSNINTIYKFLFFLIFFPH